MWQATSSRHETQRDELPGSGSWQLNHPPVSGSCSRALPLRRAQAGF